MGCVCILIIPGSTLKIKVMGQRSRSLGSKTLFITVYKEGEPVQLVLEACQDTWQLKLMSAQTLRNTLKSQT